MKARRLKSFIEWFHDRFDLDLDRMFACSLSSLREELLEVRGIGRETADAILLYAGQMPNTFEPGVDVVVIGKYASNGALITADQLQTKCPSKYEGSASPAAQSGQ